MAEGDLPQSLVVVLVEGILEEVLIVSESLREEIEPLDGSHPFFAHQLFNVGGFLFYDIEVRCGALLSEEGE